MSTDAMPLAEALEVVERYGKILEETQLFGRIGRAQVTLCAAVRRMEADRALLRNAHTVLQRAMAYRGYPLGPLSEPIAQKVLQDLTAALAAEGGDDGTAE